MYVCTFMLIYMTDLSNNVYQIPIYIISSKWQVSNKQQYKYLKYNGYLYHSQPVLQLRLKTHTKDKCVRTYIRTSNVDGK